MEDKILPKLAEVGGPAGLVEGLKDGPAGGLLSKVTGGADEDEDGDGGNAGDGAGKGRIARVTSVIG